LNTHTTTDTLKRKHRLKHTGAPKMPIQILKEIEQEVTSFLSNLIRINTTNPPGNETAAANFISNYLSKEGLKTEIIESTPGRGNLITRLKGTGEKTKPAIALTPRRCFSKPS